MDSLGGEGENCECLEDGTFSGLQESQAGLRLMWNEMVSQMMEGV